MRTEFFMAMIPPTITYQEKDIKIVKNKKGKYVPIVYEPPELEAARTKLTAHLAKNIPKIKYTKACQAIVKWCFPITGNHYDGEYKDTKPDAHNLDKMLFDIMEDLGFWDNDARVASEIIEKFYANIPGIYICIKGPLNGGDTP